MSVKYLNYVNLTCSSEEQPNERTPSPPPRKKSLSPPEALSKSISSKSTHCTSSSSPKVELLEPEFELQGSRMVEIDLLRLLRIFLEQIMAAIKGYRAGSGR
nr:hypothetical protein [Tanacetum cinerariifolium]